jgi:hypothetical protein
MKKFNEVVRKIHQSLEEGITVSWRATKKEVPTKAGGTKTARHEWGGQAGTYWKMIEKQIPEFGKYLGFVSTKGVKNAPAGYVVYFGNVKLLVKAGADKSGTVTAYEVEENKGKPASLETADIPGKRIPGDVNSIKDVAKLAFPKGEEDVGKEEPEPEPEPKKKPRKPKKKSIEEGIKIDLSDIVEDEKIEESKRALMLLVGKKDGWFEDACLDADVDPSEGREILKKEFGDINMGDVKVYNTEDHDGSDFEKGANAALNKSFSYITVTNLDTSERSSAPAVILSKQKLTNDSKKLDAASIKSVVDNVFVP